MIVIESMNIAITFGNIFFQQKFVLIRNPIELNRSKSL